MSLLDLEILISTGVIPSISAELASAPASTARKPLISLEI